MINAAKQISTAKFEGGCIGALSPTPKSFIDLILKDDLFCNHGSEICDDTNDYGVTFHSKSGEIDRLNDDHDVVDYDCKNSCMESPHNTKQKESIPTEKISVTTDYQKLDFTSVISVVDIGSGDGRWLTAFYDKFHCLCFGVEMDEDRLEICRKNLDIQYSYNDDDTNCCNALGENRNKKARNDKIELILGDFGTFDCSGISVVIVYLSRVGNEIIKDKLEKECSKGTLVIVVGVSFLSSIFSFSISIYFSITFINFFQISTFSYTLSFK
jgi:SAM-dependent methyltransferase